MTRIVALPGDLLEAVDELARDQGKTPEQVIEEATRRHLSRRRLEKLVRRNGQRAQELGIREADIAGIIEEFRREQRGRE